MRGASLFSCLAFCTHAIIWTPRLTHGFAMYYTYSRMVVEGESLSDAYDRTIFNSKIREYGFDVLETPNNLPTSALAFIPIGLYGIRVNERLGLVLLTLVFLWKPTYDTIALGQIYFILLLLFVLSMKGMMRDRAAPTAFPLALAFLLKGYGLIPILVLAVRKRWRAAGPSPSSILMGAIATLPLLGFPSWVAFGSTVLPSLGQSPPDGQQFNPASIHLRFRMAPASPGCGSRAARDDHQLLPEPRSHSLRRRPLEFRGHTHATSK